MAINSYLLSVARDAVKQMRLPGIERSQEKTRLRELGTTVKQTMDAPTCSLCQVPLTF